MRQLKKELKAVSKELKKLSQMAEKMSKRVARLEKAQAPEKPKPRAKTVKGVVAKKVKRGSASDTILQIIIKSKKGIDTPALIKKTGFKGRKIYDIVNRLKKEGKIKSGGYGLYVKA